MVSERPASNVITVNSAEQDDRIDSVTVFQIDRAEVRRRITLELKKGQNQVVVERLPSCVHEDSIRVDGTGNAVIFDVVYHSPYACPSKTSDSEALASSRRQLEILKKEIEIVQQQTKFLNSYGQSLRSENINFHDVEQFLDAFCPRQISLAKRTQELEAQVARAQKVYDDARAQAHVDSRGAKRGTKVTVTVLAEADGEAELILTYVVSNASWTPLYDVRASISNSPGVPSAVRLHYRASITQTTGEDWPEVALTLSTASPQLGSSVPSLSTWRIGFPQPPAAASSRKRRGRVNQFLDVEAEVEDDEELIDYEDEDDDEPAPADFIEDEPIMTSRLAKVTSAGALNATFGIPGRSNIPSDESSHKVVVTVLDLAAELEWICVPRAKENVFMRCQAVNSSEFVLLPGEANVFVDGNFVSKTRIEHVAPNDTFKVSLGVDSSLRVAYPSARTLNRTITHSSLPFMAKGTKFSISSHSQRIVVRNSRATSIPALRVLDHLPVSTDTLIDVNTLVPAGLVSQASLALAGETTSLGKRKGRPWKDVRKGVKARWADLDDGGEGTVEWICDIQPSEELELELGWEVKAPAGRNWVVVP
ncbi:hypothetical protein FRC08_005035 [Ceratobasidium sp. 394]|nr:hypothetical protein FRC08_005035 [Ceratobasidium sp. 394]